MNAERLKKINALVKEYDILYNIFKRESQEATVTAYSRDCEGKVRDTLRYSLPWDDVKLILMREYNKLKAELKDLGYEE